MSRAHYPYCPFCTDTTTCVRHKDKNSPKETKPKKAIAKVSPKNKKVDSEKERKKRLTEFYNECLNRVPHFCMESGEPLFNSTIINPRTVCCHILEKSKFPSIECNFDNIIYLSALQHSRFDLQTERFLKESKISGLIKERVQLLLPLLTEYELTKVSQYLL